MSKEVSVNSLVKLNQQQINTQLRLENLEKELSTNPIFKQYLETKKKIGEFEKLIKQEAEHILEESGQKSIQTDLVKITRVDRNNYEIEDIEKVNPKFVEFKPILLTQLKEFKEQITLEGQIPGVTNKITSYVKVTWSNKESQ